MKKAAVLISGTGTNAEVIAEKCFKNEIDAEITCVGSDNSDAPGLNYAVKKDIPVFSVDYKKTGKSYDEDEKSFSLPSDFNYEEIDQKISFVPSKNRQRFLKTRAAAEKELLDKLLQYKPDLLILAGYMKTLTPYFIDRFSPDPFDPRIMNIHPALLPSFPGVDGYKDTFFYGCKKGGCTVHFVDYGTDSGPVIVQKSFDILPGDRLEDVKNKGIKLEWEAYPEAVDLFCREKLLIKENSRVLKNGRIEKRKIVEIV
jgi:phosphoribosylglycinamide formyltransferase-1